MFDTQQIKQDFPILSRKVEGKPLVYLDNGATSQKPQVVIDAIVDYYSQHNANVHRGIHTLSEESTELFESAKTTIAHFFDAQKEELILTRNTTEAMNGIMYGWGLHNLQEGDVILSSIMEHHANIVPWQELCKLTGAQLEFVIVDENGRVSVADLESRLKKYGDRVKLVALTHVSNTLGTVNDIERIARKSKIKNPKLRIAVDGAQAAPHMKINFQKLGVDFFAFSGHKMLGPMGSGGLLVKKELLESGTMRPWLFGGGMIDSVSTEATTFHEDLSERFVAGTPDVASTVGLAAACDYLSALGMSTVEKYDRTLITYALKELAKIPEVHVVGPQTAPGELDRLGCVSFMYQGVHAHDVAQILASEGVAVRSGHHCCMPLHKNFHWMATVRASFQVYNSTADIDGLVKALKKVKKVFG